MLVGLYFNDISFQLNRTRIENGNYDLPRDCFFCGAKNSIIGNGKRYRWCIGSRMARISVRRGKCKCCKKTFTFLPTFARPYSRYSVEVIQNTFLSFYSDSQSSLFQSVPEIPFTACTPDFKTLYNWLHEITEKTQDFIFDFQAGPTSVVNPFVVSQTITKKVRVTSLSLFEKLHSWLIALKEHFDKGICGIFRGIPFHPGNFFQALFAVENILMWKLT